MRETLIGDAMSLGHIEEPLPPAFEQVLDFIVNSLPAITLQDCIQLRLVLQDLSGGFGGG